MDENANNTASAGGNAVTSGGEFIAAGMSIRRRRRKKRDAIEDLAQDATGAQTNGSPPIPFSPPYDESCRNCELDPASGSNGTLFKRQDSAGGSEYEPASSWDTTSGNSNPLSVVSNSCNSETSHCATNNHHQNNVCTQKPTNKVTTTASEASSSTQYSAQVKQNVASTMQRSMIDCQKMRFARNLAEFQGGLHKCGISVKDHIDIYRRFKQLAVTVPIESDSFTDNPAATKSQKPQRRHKRRMKKMAIDMASPIDANDLEIVAQETNRRKGTGASKSSLEVISYPVPEVERENGNGTLTRSKPSSDNLRNSDLALNVSANTSARKSPWKNIPFKFSSDYNFSTSVINHDDSSNQTMEFDGQSSNTIEGQQSGTLNTSSLSNPLVMSDIEHQTSSSKILNISNISAISKPASDGDEVVCTEDTAQISDVQTIDKRDDVFGNSDSNESSIDTSSPSQDEAATGIFTADEGREGDDELSENDETRSVCGLPCAVPWWEEGEISEVTHRPEFDAKLNQILEGIKAVTSHDSVNAFLQSSAALGTFHPGICKRALPSTTEVLDSRDNSSESYEHLTSPDGSSKSKRSRYSIVGNGSSRQRYAKFYYSSKHKKKRRRSYSGELKNRPTSSRLSGFRECPEPSERVLPESNVGHKMLLNMGWTPGGGLGSEGKGISEPVVLKSQINKKGFGYFAKPTGC